MAAVGARPEVEGAGLGGAGGGLGGAGGGLGAAAGGLGRPGGAGLLLGAGLWVVGGVVVVGVVPGDGLVVFGVVVVGLELLGEGQDSSTLATGPGRLSEVTGAPGGSWNFSTWPLTRVTVTVQSAADALGNEAPANAARTVPTVASASATLSLGRLNTVALSPPAVP